ncbi:hypothetical protein UK82_02045 [Frankia sp. ACN1ag]|nr:hypothetical protein UK82_02045 [Frankia sp. ACN1ag]
MSRGSPAGGLDPRDGPERSDEAVRRGGADRDRGCGRDAAQADRGIGPVRERDSDCWTNGADRSRAAG